MIKKKPPQAQQINPNSPDPKAAQAFASQASVNQTQIQKSGAEEKKKEVLLRLWQSEIDQIDEAVRAAAAKRSFSRQRLNRHAWIVEAIFEKIKRFDG